jgi:hypothetical protein
MGWNNPESPVREYRTIVLDSNTTYSNRILIGTPATGNVRIEWYQSRVGQMTPPNWSTVTMLQFINSVIPMRYQVADAQNIIVNAAVEQDFEWMFLLEHDTLMPPDGFLRFNQYMQEEKVPIVSGLYYTRSHPTEPLIYRGRGSSCFLNWEFGDLVWCDGVPTGCLLVHCGILREMWKDAEEYTVHNQKVRRVFDTPVRQFYDPEKMQQSTMTGTSDLDWCTKVMKGNYFKRAGWDKYQEMKYPFLVDTNIFCRHINPDGSVFPEVSWFITNNEKLKREEKLHYE